MELARPRPWIAFLLALLTPGLGHFYAGSLRGVLAAVAFWIAGMAFIVWLLRTPFGASWPIALMPVAIVALVLIPPFHAIAVARGRTAHRLPVRWQRVAACVAYLLGVGWLANQAALFVRAHVVQTYRVPSASMHPTLLPGDSLVADVTPSAVRELPRGGVIIYRMAVEGMRKLPADLHPDAPVQAFVSRVIGLPEDAIEIDSFGLRLNGVPVPHEHTGSGVEALNDRPLELFEENLDGVRHAIAKMGARDARLFPRTTVEPDRVFVMGDNRDNSNDSRYAGTTHRNDVVGVVSHIYFSRDPETGEIRWNRIGRVVR